MDQRIITQSRCPVAPLPCPADTQNETPALAGVSSLQFRASNRAHMFSIIT